MDPAANATPGTNAITISVASAFAYAAELIVTLATAPPGAESRVIAPCVPSSESIVLP